MGREITLEEELINLKESYDTLRVARESLERYPEMMFHMEQERRVILKHCIGLLYRKSQERHSSEDELTEGIKGLVRLIIQEMKYTGKRVNYEIINKLRPYMPWHRRILLGIQSKVR